MMIYCDNGHAGFLLPFAAPPAFRFERLRPGLEVALPDILPTTAPFKGDKIGDNFAYFKLFQSTLAYWGKCDTGLLFIPVYKGKLRYIKPRKVSDPSPHTTKKIKRL